MEKKYSAFCFILTGVFYIIQVSILGFTVYYLIENGYTASEAGILLAFFGIFAIVVQRFLGYLADTNPKVYFKNILIWMGIITILLFVCMHFLGRNKLIAGILFGTTFVCTNSMSPFVNESCFYYRNKGINVDFGKARGIGSLAFAIVSYILGGFTDIYGAKSVSFNGIISGIVFLIIIIFMPKIKMDDATIKKNSTDKLIDNKNSSNIIHMVKKYPSFFLVVLATTFAMCFQNADCGYLITIIEDLGGHGSNLGIANAIAAIVELPTMFMITKIMKKIKVKMLIVIACAFYILRGFTFCIPNITAVYVAQILQMFTFAIIIPSTVYLSDLMMHKEDKNQGQTFIGMAVTVGMILGSFVGGQLIAIGGVSLLKFGSVIIAILSFVFALLGNLIN